MSDHCVDHHDDIHVWHNPKEKKNILECAGYKSNEIENDWIVGCRT